MRTVDDGIVSWPGMPFGLFPDADRGEERLKPLDDFGSNPGQLRASMFVPKTAKRLAPLVVVLHGCTQAAAGYDRGSGWSQLAEQHGFALLYPEQQRANNANLCFNWFEPGDIRRGDGEAESIQQMIVTMIAREKIDPARVFVTGLSAGGAMTAVMLATYPELFAGGAIIAGLPYGSAGNVTEALRKMRNGDRADARVLADRVRSAAPHEGRQPTLSVWHGTADRTVNPNNGEAIVAQWRTVMGLPKTPSSSKAVGDNRRTVWRDEHGHDLLEYWQITGLGHGTPLATTGPDACGEVQPHMLEAGISSTREIARFWDLIPAASAHAAPRKAASPPPAPPKKKADSGSDVGRVIEDALRAAGLMR